MPTNDWNATAATWGGASLSLHGFLANLHLHRQLLPLLRQAVIEQRLLQEAREAGLTVSTEELQQAADLFRRRQGLSTAEATRDWLRQTHWSTLALENALESELLIDRYKDHLFQGRLAGHFEANRASYDQAALRLIVVGREDLALELLNQIREEGREFAALAAEHSTHPSRGQGGQLGLVRRYQLAEGLAGAVFSAGPGDLLGPLADAGGYQVWLVEQVRPAELDAPTVALVRQQLFDAWVSARLADTPMTFPLPDLL